MDAWVSVVMIRGYTDNGSLAYGSGVIVGENEVVTNCHVLRNTKKPWVSQGEYAFSITSVKADPWKDLCLLTVFNLNRTPVPIGNSMDLYKGQELAGIGHSNGAPVPLTTGGYVISAYDMNEGGRIILSSAKFRLGASGSGLFDMDGKLVGINTFKTTGYGSYYSVPAEWIHEVRKLPASNEFPIQGKALWEEDEDKKPYFLKIAIPKTKKNWAELEAVTKEWVKNEPNNTEAWYELGYAYEKLGKISDALKSYDKALEIDENNSDALLREAVIYKSRGDSKKVAQIQSTLDAVDPNKAWILKNNKY
jgi:tetratricopeptide (TPR) repeat protein